MPCFQTFRVRKFGGGCGLLSDSARLRVALRRRDRFAGLDEITLTMT